MKNSITLGRIWGIPVGLHWSWFVIFAVVTISLATVVLPREYPELGVWSLWIAGAATSLLLFASVLVHELTHSWFALRHGVAVKEISLFLFGGVARTHEEPKSASAELRIAVAGPIASLALSVVFGMAWWLESQLPLVAAPALWLARMNLALAIFNLIPGLPLDGGRALRAVVWGLTGDIRRADRLAGRSGQVVGAGLIGFGVYLAWTTGAVLGGVWTIFVGWFLFSAAARRVAIGTMQDAMEDVRVADVMSTRWAEAPSHVSLRDMVEKTVLPSGERFFVVMRAGRPVGVIAMSDLTSRPRSEWDSTSVQGAMVPWDNVAVVERDAALSEALRRMEERDVSNMPVLHDGAIVGVLERDRIVEHIRLRAELGVDTPRAA